MTAEELWTNATHLLKSQVSDAVWQSTFSQLVPIQLNEDSLILGMPNGIIRDKLDGRYRPLVEDAVEEAAQRLLKVEFQLINPTLFDFNHNIEQTPQYSPGLQEPTTINYANTAGNTVSGLADHEPGEASVGADPQLAVDLRDRYTFKSFVTGPSNRFAAAAALSVAERPGISYNPLFIYGSAGLGKTHMLLAIKHFINDIDPTKQVLYVSTETFLNEFVDSIKNSSGNDFKRRYRQIDVLLVDDIQFIEGKDRLQEELFHTFNDLHGRGRQIVLSSDRVPDAIPTLEERLKSRFMMGLLTDIQPPDIETRMAILSKKAERDGYHLPNDVSEFIAANIKNNIRELEGALNKVTAFAYLHNDQKMDKGLAEQVLGDFIADRQPRPITIDMILQATVEQFGFPVEELLSKSRRRPLVGARQMAMYVARELTDMSYPHIAREFGGRDHTTVMHACDKIAALMRERSQIYNHVTVLEKTIRKRAQSNDYR